MTKTKFVLLFLSVVLMADSGIAIIVSDASFEDAPEVPDGGQMTLDSVTTPWFRTITGNNPWIGRNYSNIDGHPQVGLDNDSYVGINHSSIHQQLDATYTDGVTYELSVWATTQLDYTNQVIHGTFTVGGDGDGLTNADELDTDSHGITTSTDSHTWFEYTFTYTAGADEAGQAIGIVFYGNDSHMYVDNVTLVPEPMTIGLLGLGAAMLRRRKR